MDGLELIFEHFREQAEKLAGMYLGLSADHTFTSEDWERLSKQLRIFLGNMLDMDGLRAKIYSSMSDEALDTAYRDLQKVTALMRKEIEGRH